jgi:hypothetical protein
MATGVFRDHVLLGVRDAALESVATDGSGTTRVPVAAWRISAGSRFVAVEGRDLASGAPTLAVSSDGAHFATLALPAEFARAPTDSVALLALDDRVLLTDGRQTANPADQLIHVWSVAVTGAPSAPPSPTPLATPAIPSSPPAEATSTWTPVTLPRAASAGAFGGPGGGLAALPGGDFIDFVPASPTRTVVFTSPDGLHWSPVVGDQSQASDTVEATAVIYSRGEFVMVGRLDNDAAAWTSRDGRHWTIHAPLPGGSDVVLEGLVSTPSGFLSLGTSGPPVEVLPGVFLSPVAPWTSKDGARDAVGRTARAPDRSRPERSDRSRVEPADAMNAGVDQEHDRRRRWP